MKVALGTVQFGLQYGISNKNGVPTDEQLLEIFSTCESNGINTFDTAVAYGNAEERISNFLPKNAEIISKFPKTESKSDLETIILNSISRLKRDNLYGFMAHNGDFLIENPQLWEVLVKLKQENKIQKIGYSLYTTEQLEQLLEFNLVPDIIQIPYSLLDRKFEPYFAELKQKNVEIHCRSVFLQGLYFLNPEKLPEKLVPLNSELKRLQTICQSNQVKISDVALNFAYSNTYIDKIVIGIENKTQLEENINSIKNWDKNDSIFDEIKLITVNNKELLNPANW
ncbi:aldo/keto reductase [Flavobacterium urocaniciphilum]|uniref:Predicted oxidoreductase n=1 Tax=Flavobacterium urocaniciphilum TaxID=1299341 RepID=A0A1H8YZX4_9FLAO|nr:aldo/keto reductase [Flavobacterium urocaniciphilum]SEP56918.1 Predicted oxidoreductase [Flavobacterium urocaniciphilum]